MSQRQIELQKIALNKFNQDMEHLKNGTSKPDKPDNKPQPISHVYFYDIVKGELYQVPVNTIPPAPTPHGSKVGDSNAGVMAYVFSCEGCKAESSQVIGYLLTYTPSTQDYINRNSNNKEIPWDEYISEIDKGTLVSTPKSSHEWYWQTSEAGQKLINNGIPVCKNGQRPTACFPK